MKIFHIFKSLLDSCQAIIMQPKCRPNLQSSKLLLVCALLMLLDGAAGCSSRSLPKPRPTTSSAILAKPTVQSTTESTSSSSTTTESTTTTSTTQRPNITFPTYKCPATYDAWYCLNEATCFSVKIGDSIMYNCECAIGFMGPRCEYKELDGSLLPKRPRPVLEMASIASGATCAMLFVCFVCLTIYLRYDQAGSVQTKKQMPAVMEQQFCRCATDKQCCADFDYAPLSMEQNAAKYRGGQHQNHMICH